MIPPRRRVRRAARRRCCGLVALLLGGSLWLPAAPAAAEELLVFAASSLADALTEAGGIWSAASGVGLAFNFAASSELARQIAAGAPADVFFSADERQMDRAQASGRIDPARRRQPLGNTLVVVVPDDGPAIGSLAELVSLPRLVLADPELVPAGVYARELLESRGLWPALAARVVPTRDVRAALAAVAAGHAPAGIVYATDARIEPRVRVALEIPADEGPRIRYSLAPVAGSPPAAGALVDFLASARAAAVWKRHGFVALR